LKPPRLGPRFYELDLLRFLAAGAVVLFHYGFRGFAADQLSPLSYPSIAPFAKYGFLGVNLFFLISGFVILMTASGGSKRHFVVSRVVRLYPAFWVCCTATFLVTLAVPHSRRVGVAQYLVNMTMLSEFVRSPAVDSVYWSLAVEIQFYALVFLTLALGQIGRAKEILGVWLALYIIVTIWPVKVLSHLLIPEFAPYFIAGAMFFLVSREGLSWYKGLIIAVCLVAVAVQAVRGLPTLESHYHTAYSRVAVCAVLAAFFVTFLLIATGRTRSVGSERWQVLGALTYPLYLLHQNIGFAIFNTLYGRVNDHLLIWGVIALMLAAAYGVNRIERLVAKPMKIGLFRLLGGEGTDGA
jgi:peptidoglycan/LPS O-acetylase OafA/YrhL